MLPSIHQNASYLEATLDEIATSQLLARTTDLESDVTVKALTETNTQCECSLIPRPQSLISASYPGLGYKASVSSCGFTFQIDQTLVSMPRVYYSKNCVCVHYIIY